MAHRTNLVQVHENSPLKGGNEKITDPVCGGEISRRESKNILFRSEMTHYFCSKECLQKFMAPRYEALYQEAAREKEQAA